MGALNYWKFLESNCSIKDKQGHVVPFILNEAQDSYLTGCVNYYGKPLDGLRDIDLKCRKLGFSSIILGIFATDFLLEDYPIGAVTIADTKPETQKLFERAKFFMNSALAKTGKKLEDICEAISTNYLKNKINGAEWWIGTAGSKVALRTETVQNLHFSEAAHFPDTDVITAKEAIEGASQMVDQGHGRIFIESTANGYGNYFQELEEKAYQGRSEYRSVFFGADKFYTPEWLVQKEKAFTTREMFLQEFPNTREDAYMSSGSKFFDVGGIRHLQSMQREPIRQGEMNSFGELI